MLRFLGAKAVWRHRDLRLMLPGRAISAFGDDMALVVLTLRVYDTGLGPWSITGLLLSFAVPVVVMARVSGRLVDSVSFRRLAIATATWQAACCTALAFATPLWSTYVLVMALQAGTAVALPAWQALVPSIAEREEVGSAVGASQAMNTLAAVAAPAVAGVTVGSLGYAAPLVVDAGTFLLLAGAAAAIRASRRAAPRDDSDAQARSHSLRDDALLWPLVVGLCVLVLVGEVTNVVEVFLLRGTLGAGASGFGLVGGLLAAAIVVGSVAAGRPAPAAVRARRAAAAALGLGLALALAGLAPMLAVFAVAWAVVGVSNGIVNVDASTLLLERTPEACRGRVLAQVNAMVRGSSVGAVALGGAAGALLGPRETFVTAGTLMSLAAVALLARMRHAGARATTSGGGAYEEGLAELPSSHGA
jgi:MFS family permease